MLFPGLSIALFCMELNYYLEPIASAWRNPIRIFYNLSMLATNTLSLCLSENLILALIFKDSFAG